MTPPAATTDCGDCGHPWWRHSALGLTCIGDALTDPTHGCDCDAGRQHLRPRGVTLTDQPAAPFPTTYEVTS